MVIRRKTRNTRQWHRLRTGINGWRRIEEKQRGIIPGDRRGQADGGGTPGH